MAPTYALNRFLVDAGIMYVNVAPGVWTPVVWGATRGGMAFNPGSAIRFPEADGITTHIGGTGRVTGYNAHITGRVMDATVESLMRMMPGSSSDNGPASDGVNNAITPINARQFITVGQQLEKILLIHRASNNTYQATYIPLGLVITWDKTAADSDEGLFNIDIEATLLPAQSPNEAPFKEITNLDLDTFDPSVFE